MKLKNYDNVMADVEITKSVYVIRMLSYYFMDYIQDHVRFVEDIFEPVKSLYYENSGEGRMCDDDHEMNKHVFTVNGNHTFDFYTGKGINLEFPEYSVFPKDQGGNVMMPKKVYDDVVENELQDEFCALKLFINFLNCVAMDASYIDMSLEEFMGNLGYDDVESANEMYDRIVEQHEKLCEIWEEEFLLGFHEIISL